MRKLLVGLFLLIYYGLLLLSVICMRVGGLLPVLFLRAGGFVVICVFFIVVVTYERYARFGVFSSVLLPTPSEYIVLALCAYILHNLVFFSLGRATAYFLQGNVAFAILYFLIGLVMLFGSYYFLSKYSLRWTFYGTLLGYGRTICGCGQAEVAVACLSTTREYEEPTIFKYTVTLDGVSNETIIGSAVIKALGNSLWRKKVFIAFKFGHRNSYLVVSSARSFCRDFDNDTNSGIEAMIDCCRFIYMHEYEMPERDNKIGLWDFWVLLKLFSCFWEDDKDTNKIIGDTEKVIRDEIRKANDGVASQIDNTHFLYLYLRGELCKRFYSP